MSEEKKPNPITKDFFVGLSRAMGGVIILAVFCYLVLMLVTERPAPNLTNTFHDIAEDVK